MNIFVVDHWLLRELEKGLHIVQRLTGKTNFWIYAKLQSVMNALLVFQLFYFFITIGRPAVVPFLDSLRDGKAGVGFCALALVCGIALEFVTSVEDLEVDAYNRLQKGLANPFKNSLYFLWFRTFAVMVLTVELLRLVLNVGTFTLMDVFFYVWYFMLYVRSCDPLPPCQSKIKEWVSSLFSVMKPVNSHA